MDELEISGKRYISSKRAAELHKYHADYIGQLIRGKKVPGQKVGRAWYIEADALAAYLGKEVPPRGPMKKAESEVPAEPVLDEVEAVEEVPEVEEVVEAPKYEPVILNMRRSREHVIEPLVVKPRQETKREIPIAIKEVYIEEEIVEPSLAVEEPYFVETQKSEETFIPLKIQEQPQQRAEDSFYKISRSGLRYIAEGRPQVSQPIQETRMQTTAAAPVVERKRVNKISSKSVVVATAAVVLAGGLSLAVLGAFSYYLKSTVSVGGEGQTSSVNFSQ